ncbi:unnamed protein product, partial [Rotaria sp. Silwood2]
YIPIDHYLFYPSPMAASQLSISNFYYACRNNDMDKVKLFLETMMSDQIDKLKPNDSTTLHAASYYGHHGIVELLLKQGASRSIKNKYNCIPYEEGNTVEIKQLFSHENVNNRFLGNLNSTIEWIRVGKHIDQEAKAIRKMLKTYSEQDKSNKKKILIEMIDLGNYEGINKIKRYFDQANDENDPKYILKAYTEETEFYQRLNRELTRAHKLNPNDENQHQLLDFLNLIFCRPSFRNAKIMTKSLLSTSKAQHIAESFAAKEKAIADGNAIKRACICIYKIRKAHTALDIEELSMFPHEQEVLLIPYSAFEVVNVQEITSNYGILTEIELHQCKSYFQTHKAIAVGGGLFTAAISPIPAFFIDDDQSQD